MKTLKDLIAVKQIVEPGTGRKIFARFDNGLPLPNQKIDVFFNPSVFLSRMYGGFHMAEYHEIPEEADSFLLGQNIWVAGKFPVKVYSANYCKLK